MKVQKIRISTWADSIIALFHYSRVFPGMIKNTPAFSDGDKVEVTHVTASLVDRLKGKTVYPHYDIECADPEVEEVPPVSEDDYEEFSEWAERHSGDVFSTPSGFAPIEVIDLEFT